MIAKDNITYISNATAIDRQQLYSRTSAMAPLTLGYNDKHPFTKVPITDRSSVQELLRTILDPLEPFFSPQKALVKCPGATAVRFDQRASEVEGFFRPLWGLACLLAGGGEYRLTEWWIQGIRAGTDPENPEYWGYPRDNDQRMVEMCPFGKVSFSFLFFLVFCEMFQNDWG